MVKKKWLTAIAAICLLICALRTAFIGATLTVFAASLVDGEDGVYSVPADLSGLAMGADNFTSEATVEKSGNSYYFTFGHSSSISNMILNMGDKQVGFTSKIEDNWTYYTYTLSESNIKNSLSFTAHILAMDRDVNFSVKIHLSSATKTGVYSYEGERPAEFVPVLTTTAGSEYQMQQGAVFPVPAATATLGSEECSVTTTAYYGAEEVVITDNCFTVENIGEYSLIYRASSSSYKTSLGNDTYTEYIVKIISSVGGSTLAKFNDKNGILPEGTAIIPSRIAEDSALYSQAAQQMKTIADDFEVFGINFITPAGENVTPMGNIDIYLQADSTYDRTAVEVYCIDESGNLIKLNASGYGRYVKVETEKTGIFIICIPGVAFVMPMWGYAVILVACVIVLAVGVTILIIFIKKKKNAHRM